jgi:ubiquinone/menaquinone biosynthesis C-methylase UbiE
MDDQSRIKQSVREQFARNAGSYVTSTSHALGDDLALMVEWLQPQKNWTVLDMATGGGHTAKALAPHVAQVLAMDLTREMLEEARRHVSENASNVSYVVGDAENVPFLDHTFDAVTCRIAAHHFPDPKRFVEEAARVLKPGGILLLIDNVVPDDKKLGRFVNTIEKLRDESHAECLSIEQWLRLLRGAGLRVEKQRIRKKTFDFPSWVRRTARSEEQVRAVETHLLSADLELQSYCGLLAEDGHIRSIHIDEWMVAAKKPE